MNGYRMTRSANVTALQLNSTGPQSRLGFTLVEILVAISIIVILMALLVPAVSGVRRTARNAAVRVELAALEKALTDFKTIYGEEPPSRVLLFETGAGWTTTISANITPLNAATAISAVEAEQLRIISISKIGKFWRQFDFAANRDINNDGAVQSAGTPLLLTGAECLTFFLGGMAAQDTVDPTRVSLIGFSSNASNPFYAGTSAAPGTPVTLLGRDASTRKGPFHEFDVSRLIDVDGDGMREYCDQLPNTTCPILYLNSRNRRFEPQDMVVFGDGLRDLTSVYTQGAGGPAWKEQSYQLISPGFDREYGTGGGYAAETGLVNSGARLPEADNITNFSSGTLE